MSAVVRVCARVERKADSLPRYVVVPGDALSSWRLAGTTPVELTVGGHDVGRRNLKRWDRAGDCWFIDLPQTVCIAAGVDTGDEVTIAMRRASQALPEEITSLLDADPAAREAWRARSPSAQRMLAEHVRAAKQPATRARRAARALRRC